MLTCSVCNGDAEEKGNLDREPHDREKAEMGIVQRIGIQNDYRKVFYTRKTEFAANAEL